MNTIVFFLLKYAEWIIRGWDEGCKTWSKSKVVILLFDTFEISIISDVVLKFGKAFLKKKTYRALLPLC